MDNIHWGILGCGRIADSFAQGLRTLKGARLTAAASLTTGRAEAFAKRFNIPKAYTDYESLVADKDVDVVYIGTLHNAHKPNTLLALERGKHVLCEKPFALNAREAAAMIRKAREKKLFLMEAMWTRFLPASRKIKRLLDEGLLGDIRYLRAEFGFAAKWNPEDRLHNLNLAGGSLLDLGIYPVSYARWVFGKKPQSLHGTAHLGQTGVDENSSYYFQYDGGASALLFSSFRINTPDAALIGGTGGYLRIPVFFHPRRFIHQPSNSRLPKIHHLPYRSTGLQYQAREVMDCIRSGRRESTVMPLDETLEIMETLDGLRRPWGLVYPEETQR
jgi:dihydrodiol dehydrogenase / D-xylose 1-dehydrogenase (NADP)